MGRTKKNIQLKIPDKPRKIKGFRSGSCRMATTISSQPRYDHFDTSPCVYFNPLFLRSKITQEFFGEKSRREHKKYSIFYLKNLINQGFAADETARLAQNFERAL